MAALSESPVAPSNPDTAKTSTAESTNNDPTSESRLRIPNLATANFTMGHF
jgi:hypothetical protein